MTKRAFVSTIAAALLAPVAAQGAVAPDTLRPNGLEAFASCAELDRYVARQQAFVHVLPMASDVAAGAGLARGAETMSAPDAAATPAFSTTNVQEAGVDEPDIVKTDGRRVFALAGNAVHWVDVTADEPRRIDELALPGWDHKLLLHGDTLVVLWQAPMGDATVLARLDASDPAAGLRLLERSRLDGWFVAARLTGATARVVTRDHGFERPDVPCRDVLRARTDGGPGSITLHTIDVADSAQPVDTDTVMTGAETVYASPTALYVATTRFQEPGSELLPPSVATAVHRFDTADPGRTAYTGSGVVQGHVLNQFSMSEHRGVLRVASTAGRESFVTTFRPDAETGDLQELGVVGGLGRDERIYAVRFMGDIGYVVTFRETDPLYTLDLSDPADPRVLGELKIRGYSAYLHPAGEDRLIGVGQDATGRGRTLGTQVSLFDVSDLRNPRRIAGVRLDAGSSSEIEYDHHAFLYWEPSGLLVVPTTTWWPRERSEATALRVGDAGLEPAGRVRHDAPVRRSLVVGDRLFTLSDGGLLASDLATLDPIAWTGLR